MHYCGLDVSRKSTYVCLDDAQGRHVKRVAIATSPAAVTATLERYAAQGLRVAIEAGNQTAWIVDLLRELGARVHIVHPRAVKQIAESKKKTDRVDAALLARLLRIDGLPEPVHLPSPRSREIRGLLVARRQLVRVRAQLINVVRGLMRQQRVSLPARALSTRIGWTRLGALPLSTALREVVSAYAATVAAASAALRALDQQLDARAVHDPRLARLQTIPGVGPRSAQTLVAAVDTIARFPTAKKLVAYSGLAPSVRASGDRTQTGAITKEGRSEIRAVWVQAAHTVLRMRPHPAAAPLQQWGQRVARRRGVRTAVVALARKLLTIAFHLLKDNTRYDPARLSRATA